MSLPHTTRRTFAIISHPDAGKTTLTEKLLLFGGAIHLAGAVKAKKEGRSARSDFLSIEQQRGISVSASVMTFEYGGHTINLLDTPGHKDFSEDTYRTLTAVDSAVMVLDAAKGIEEQTRKLFEVCRLRDIPVITFINKMDREARDNFELLDDISSTLALDTAPLTWPIGSGERFKGCYDLRSDSFFHFDAKDGERIATGEKLSGIDDPRLAEIATPEQLAEFREQVSMVRELCPPFNEQSYLEGHLTPVFFGSAMFNFGVRELLQALIDLAPAPRPQAAAEREVRPEEPNFSAFVFKVQANMDKNHRDRIAFARICSGKYTRGMKVRHVRSDKILSLTNPVMFLAAERELAEEAWPGDIIGIPGHGTLRIGDTLTEKESLTFKGVPSFAPEVFRRAVLADPLKSKQLKKGLEQLSEEGASQLFKPLMGSDWIIGVVGPLQFDVIADRIKGEYGVEARFEQVNYATARWVSGDKASLEKFREKHKFDCAEDAHGSLTYLAPNSWHLARIQQDWPDLVFAATREQS